MNAPSIDIKAMIDAESSVSQTIYVGIEPPTPNNVVTIYDTGGSGDLLTMDNTKYEFPSVQIRVRHTDYQSGWELISSIKDILHGRANETWGTTFYALIACVNGPMFLMQDTNQRMIFICNFNLQRR